MFSNFHCFWISKLVLTLAKFVIKLLFWHHWCTIPCYTKVVFMYLPLFFLFRSWSRKRKNAIFSFLHNFSIDFAWRGAYGYCLRLKRLFLLFFAAVFVMLHSALSRKLKTIQFGILLFIKLLRSAYISEHEIIN